MDIKNTREKLLEDWIQLSRLCLLESNLDLLDPLFEKKRKVVQKLKELPLPSEDSKKPSFSSEEAQDFLRRKLEAILENERALEERMEQEMQTLKKSLQSLEKRKNLRQYLAAFHASQTPKNL